MGKIKNLLSKLKNLVWRHKIISIIVLVAIIIIGIIVWPKGGKPVLTETASIQDVIKTVSVTGTIDAQTSVNLTFQLGGTLTYLGVKNGDAVKAYQTIATLDQRTVQKNLQIALANYSQQRNSFETNMENSNPNNLDVNNLNLQLKRILQDNQFDLDKAVYSVELQDLVRQQSILTTPIAGIVTRADVATAGVNVNPTTTFTITDPNSLDFKMEVDEADIGQIKYGQIATASLDSFPNDNLKLTVDNIDFVSHLTTSGGNTFFVKANLPQNNNYRVGMNGNADIIINAKYNVLTIQSSDVIDNNYVYVKTTKGFVKTKLVLGLQNDTQAQVLSGLSEGDTVAIDPTSVPQNLIVKN